MTPLETWKELADTTDLRWPEWEEKDADGRAKANDALRWQREGFFVGRFRRTDGLFLCWLHSVSDHEAESLFERHARRWLQERGWEIRHDACGYYPFTQCSPPGHRYFSAGSDYVTALQSAVRAAHKEGKESQ